MDAESELEKKIRYLGEKYPLTVHTGVGRLVSTLRRMKAEKELEIPINRRTGFVVSVEKGKPANELDPVEWEEFFVALCDQLKRDYPDLHRDLFDDAEPGAQP